jgi:hypothetical protein
MTGAVMGCIGIAGGVGSSMAGVDGAGAMPVPAAGAAMPAVGGATGIPATGGAVAGGSVLGALVPGG